MDASNDIADSRTSEPSEKSQKSKVNVKISEREVIARSSTINTVQTSRMASSRCGLFRSPSNFFFDSMEKMQLRTPLVKVDSKTKIYEKLKVNSSQQYFRDDWGGVTAIRYFQDGDKIAIGFNSGDLLVCTPMVSPTMRNGPCEPILKGWEGNDSISCIRFHPKKPSFIYSSSTAGVVMRRDLEDNINYNDFFISESGNEIYGMDFSSKCDLVTVGRDATIRMYDIGEEKLLGELGSTSSSSVTLESSDSQCYHEKRIYCVCCHPEEPNVFISGGWDGVKVWDLRTNIAVRNIVGPFIFGDTVDLCGGVVLTASCGAGNCLQLWDLGSGRLIEDLDPSNKRVSLYGEYPYVAKFYKGDSCGDLVLYGVDGLQVISVKEASILYLFEDDKPVTAVDSTDKKFAFGGKSHSVLHGRVTIPESDVTSKQSVSIISRTISSRSAKSSESEFRRQDSDYSNP